VIVIVRKFDEAILDDLEVLDDLDDQVVLDDHDDHQVDEVAALLPSEGLDEEDEEDDDLLERLRCVLM
jgi:hypothetical protein